jgi:hypothetical protein
MLLTILVLGANCYMFGQDNQTSIQQYKDEAAIEAIANEAPVIVVGEVLSVGSRPGFWSGLFPAAQDVHYVILEVIKGSPGKNLLVRHLVVKNSLTADSEIPQLSTKMFAKGQKLILFLEPIPKKDGGAINSSATKTDYQTLNENLGAISFTLKSREILSKYSVK